MLRYSLNCDDFITPEAPFFSFFFFSFFLPFCVVAERLEGLNTTRLENIVEGSLACNFQQ